VTTSFAQACTEVGVGEIDILDCHGHVGPTKAFPIPRPEPRDVVATMDRLGIRTTFVSALSGAVDERIGDADARAAAAAFPGRLEAVPILNPHRPELALAILDEHKAERATRMVKVHSSRHSYPVTGPGYTPIFDEAGANGWAVLSHTWGGQSTCDPAMFDAVARRHPRTAFILGHSGATREGIRSAVAVAKAHRNVYLDLACTWVWDGMLEWMVEEVGSGKVLFGTDVAFLDPRPQLGRVVLARMPTPAKQHILGASLLRLIGGLSGAAGGDAESWTQ
jgi:predicted TIM-barrel fold metal-dependent hydrolase